MNILTTGQYNQGMGRSKLLSSTSGVGAVITTKAGYYVLISDITRWRCMEKAHDVIEKIRRIATEDQWAVNIRTDLQELGLTTIDDPRFIAFLREEKELTKLVSLVAIPHLALHEHFNTVNVANNPIIKELKAKGKDAVAEDFMLPATHFPKWFRNKNGDLMTYEGWLQRWLSLNIRKQYFAPPRDAHDPVRKGGKNGPEVKMKLKDQDGVEEWVTLYNELTQINLTLICPNGHLSDIPWSRYLGWKAAGGNKQSDNLFDHAPCCANPQLRWTENKNRSDGYSSIYLECMNKSCSKKVNLDGVNNLKPCCKGETPWTIDVDDKDHNVPRSDKPCLDPKGIPQTMQVALATANNTYFANGFTSIYIPQQLIDGIDKRVAEMVEKYTKKYERVLEFDPYTKEAFYDKYMNRAQLASDGWGHLLTDISDLEEQLRRLFMGVEEEPVEDTHEHYRWQEYQCFLHNAQSTADVEDLSFKDIILPAGLDRYFAKIQQVEELKVCQVQLDFTRVKPVERIKRGNRIVNSHEGQDIYSLGKDNLFVLPANEIYGEGLFLGLNEAAIHAWYEKHCSRLQPMLKALIGPIEEYGQGSGSKRKIISDGLYGAKFLLIHSLSHLLMRELEFSCGYPTASLKERLFISERMSGILIYTAEGAEGSMGGLVWQGQRDKIEDLLRKALDRAQDCASDPLCWTSEGQGLFNLNLAACFSCSMVSETACEEWNLGLDRRVLIDPVYGFFADY